MFSHLFPMRTHELSIIPISSGQDTVGQKIDLPTQTRFSPFFFFLQIMKVRHYFSFLAPLKPCSRDVWAKRGWEDRSEAPLFSPHHFGVLAGNVQLEHITALHTVNHPERDLQRKGKLRLRSPLPTSLRCWCSNRRKETGIYWCPFSAWSLCVLYAWDPN